MAQKYHEREHARFNVDDVTNSSAEGLWATAFGVILFFPDRRLSARDHEKP
jgi:hypothetical protein